MFQSQNLLQAFDRVTDYWSPKVVGRVNDQLLKVAKLKGQLVWHAHDDADELFYVLKGSMQIELEPVGAEPQTIALREGDVFTVPRGVRHNPVADEECWIVLIEPATTKHTGDEIVPQTRSLDEQFA